MAFLKNTIIRNVDRSDILLVMAPSWGTNMPPLGLEYINAYLKLNGYASEILDLNIELFSAADEQIKDLWSFENHRYWAIPEDFKVIINIFEDEIEDIVHQLMSYEVKVIGFSVNAGNRLFTLEILKKFKKFRCNESPLILIGGPLCRFSRNGKIILKDFNNLVDLIAIGEGEKTTSEILCHIKNGKVSKSIPGVLQMGECDEKSFVPHVPENNLNTFPFPVYNRERILKKYTENLIPILMSRGCLGRCSFCDGRFFQPGFRTREPAEVVKELKYHVRFTGIRNFTFNDLAINWNIGKLEQLCDLIIDEELDIIWNASATIHKGMSSDLFYKIEKAGCTSKGKETIFGIQGGSLVFGLESGSDTVLRRMNKGYTSEDAERVLKLCHNANITTIVNIIVGFPGESDMEFNETLNFLEKNKTNITRLGTLSLCYIPEFSDLSTSSQKFNITFPENDPQFYWFDDKNNNFEMRQKRGLELLDLTQRLGIPPLATTLNYGKAKDKKIEITKANNIRRLPSANQTKIIELSSTLPPRILLIMCPPWGVESPPISLGYLARFLDRQNIAYSIFDLNLELFNHSEDKVKNLWNVENDHIWRENFSLEMMDQIAGLKDAINKIIESQAPIIGFSLIDPNQFIACELIGIIKRKCPQKKIVVGGPVCSTLEERLWLRDKTDGLIDFIVVGEGEKPLSELINEMEKSSLGNEVRIPSVIDCCHNQTMTPYLDNAPLDLREISFPDYKGFPFDCYGAKVAAVMWSRGCISNCAFCKEKSLWDKHRTRSVKDILDEIKFYKGKNISQFVVYDSLVNGKPKHIEELCDAIISQKLDIRWSALAIPDKSLNKSLLEKMRQAGCFVLIYGLESGSEKVLKRMRKRFQLKDAIATIKNTRDVGIETAINIMVGFPGEGEVEFGQTIAFIEKYHNFIDRLDAVTPLQLVRGTYLFNHYQKFGIRLPEEREHEYWFTEDETNTYEIRMKRRQKVVETCNRYSIEIRKGFHGKEDKTSKRSNLLLKSQYETDILFIEFTDTKIPDYDTASILESLDQNNICAKYLFLEKKAQPNIDPIARLKDYDAKLLAVKSPLEQYENFVEILSNIRNIKKKSIIIIWGSGCRTEKQRTSFPPQYFDAIIFQQYEKAFKKLVYHFGQNGFRGNIPGVHIYGQSYTPLSPPKDLSRFAFPKYEAFHKELYDKTSLSIRLSKGCPYRCSFCPIYLEEGPFRVRKPESVYEEMCYHYENNGVSEYVFEDSAINGDRKALEALCHILAPKNIPLSWKAKYIIFKNEQDFPFREMAATGCTQLNFGFVSGSQHVLRLMGKPFDVKAVENALRKIKETEIRCVMRLMVGFPGEMEPDFLDTVRFLINNKEYIDDIDIISPCYIQPGSELEKTHEKYGIILTNLKYWQNWHDGSYNNSSYRLKKSKEMLIFLEKLGLTSFIPEYLKKDTEILEKSEQIFERYHLFNDPITSGIFSKKQIFAGPETLEIDLTNNCNLSCIGCWCHSPLLGKKKFAGEKKKKYIPKKTVLNLLDEVRNLGGNATVQLAGAGEPFLHPDIWEIIETIKKHGMGCSIITNFTLIEENEIKRLIDYGVDSITASVWAGDEETYQRTHPGTSIEMFERLKKNLSLLTESRGTGTFPNLKIYHVISSRNADSINPMVDFALRTGADSVELTMLDVVPGKSDSLLPDSEAQERILEQFKSIRSRPDYTSELIRTEHLEPFANKMFFEELKEFGRIYPILPDGFSYGSNYNSIYCPLNKNSIRKDISLNDSSVTFSFDKNNCEQCTKRNKCWGELTQMGTICVRPMTILGAGSFLRRLTSSKREIQEYEYKIIDCVPCTVGWTYARITVDGDVIPCCKASGFSLGNLHQDTFSNIWQSLVYSEFRLKAKELSKKDPYFSKINCYRSCDNLGMNLHTHLRLLSYSNGINNCEQL